jgi:uncharacterized protein YbaA (DUF1428 family)
MAYIDGFVMAVPAEKKQAFLEVSEVWAKYLKELGATRVVQTWGDDVPEGKLTDFRRAVAAEKGEIVSFGWAEYPSKAVREAAKAKMQSDERMNSMEMPFDGKRMIFGGFDSFVEL